MKLITRELAKNVYKKQLNFQNLSPICIQVLLLSIPTLETTDIKTEPVDSEALEMVKDGDMAHIENRATRWNSANWILNSLVSSALLSS